MRSPSRRAFLRGRQAANTPWGQFCLRLRRTVSGTLQELETIHGQQQACLYMRRASDIRHAMALCNEYGIALALNNTTLCVPPVKPVLWVEPGNDSSGCNRLEPGGTRWFVQPGCTMASLVEAGLTAFNKLPHDLTIAAWVADRKYSGYATGCTHNSGIEHAKLLLGDGTSLALGPFGTQNTKPLEGWRAQALVSSLFRLTTTPEAQSYFANNLWQAKYRLDALLDTSGKGINLAQLLLGHGGSLGWLEWVVIDTNNLKPEQVLANACSIDTNILDEQIKSLFDPGNVLA